MAEHPSAAAALIGLAVVLAAAAGCGMALLRALRADSDSVAEQFVMGSAIGLGLLAYAILAVGLLGYLRPAVLLALVLIGAALGAPALAGWARSVKGRIQSPASAGTRGTERGRSAATGAGPRGRIHRDGQDRQDQDRQDVEAGDYPPDPVHPVHPCELARSRSSSVLNEAPGYAAAALVFGCLLIAAITLIGALAPPNGDDWDSLTYHLAAPKIYLAHHRIFFIPYDSHTDFPFTLEMLYTLGLAYGGAAGAKLFHWAAGWLTALGIAAFCGRLRRGTPLPTDDAGMRMPHWVPPLAAALFLSIPQVQWQATTAYIDMGTSLYQFLALVAFVYAVSTAEPVAYPAPTPCPPPPKTGGGGTEAGSLLSSPSPSIGGGGQGVGAGATTRGWLIVSGLMSGWAMGTKMTAMLPFGLLVLAAILWAALRTRPAKPGAGDGVDPITSSHHHPPASRVPVTSSAAWWSVAGLFLAGVLVASPWYVKSYLWTHNPVYPFFYSLFPHSVGWTREAEIAYQHEQHFFGLGQGAKALLMVPWNLAMQGWAYFTVPTRHSLPGTLPYFDGLRRGGISATFLALVPLALFTRRWDRRLTGLIIYALALLLPWFLLSQQSRYLLPITAALAVVAAAVVANLEADLPRWAASAFAALVLFLHVSWGWSEIVQRTWPVVSGQVSPTEYLRRTFGPYEAMEYINRLPANTKVAMYQETRGFYLDREYLWANPLQNTLIPYQRLNSGAALVQFLKTRLGVTHVLLNRAGLDEITKETTWYLLLNNAIEHDDLVPVFAAHEVEVYAIP